MRIMSWNVNGRGDQLAQQLDAVLVTDPDVVALQEVVEQKLNSLVDARVA